MTVFQEDPAGALPDPPPHTPARPISELSSASLSL